MMTFSDESLSGIETITFSHMFNCWLTSANKLRERLITAIHVKSCLLCICAVVITCISIYVLVSSMIEQSAERCVVYNVPHILRAQCQLRERVVCNTIDTMTTFSPCFPSTLLDSSVACHDSVSCQDPSNKRKTQLSTTDLSRRAFFSALFTDNYYLEGALLLGHTLKKHHPHHQMYMMHLHNALSNRTLCSLREVGWIPRAVQNIAPPLHGTRLHFINQFTKLTLWNMTDFDAIVYLDLDTLVFGDISQLHELVADPSRTGFEFAAVADNWFGKFAYHFNAGVLVLHPSTAVFNELLRTMSVPANYHPPMAEQAFLNAFFQLRYLQLPVIYNVNMAMYSAYPELWKKLERDFKIVHFTVVKLFRNQSTRGYEIPLKLYEEVRNDYMNTTGVSHRVTAKCA